MSTEDTAPFELEEAHTLLLAKIVAAQGVFVCDMKITDIGRFTDLAAEGYLKRLSDGKWITTEKAA